MEKKLSKKLDELAEEQKKLKKSQYSIIAYLAELVSLLKKNSKR
jgi:hypothetical protein